ncbi:MAG: 6-carboxytetrahydropterin synthase [Phycisphaerales bacterium]|nr:6-carboxytetrahydropterin synthase [Phycisphaerales bacterium]
MRKIAISRKESFNAAHRLHCDSLSLEENINLFGKCNNPNYHGHNYTLIVTLIGVPDLVTGLLLDIRKLSEIIKAEVVERLDHKNLNLDVPEFKNLNPSAENMAFVIYDILRKAIEPQFDLKIRLYETENNFVDYPYL